MIIKICIYSTNNRYKGLLSDELSKWGIKATGHLPEANVMLLHTDSPRDNVIKYVHAIKEINSIPIIVLSDSYLESFVNECYKAGIFSYWKLPMEPQEMTYRIMASIRNPFRRVGIPEMIKYRGVILEYLAVRQNGNSTIRLTPTQYQILRYLMIRPGNYISKEEMLMAVFGNDDHFQSRSLDVQLAALRKKIKGTPLNITTKLGYGFILGVLDVQTTHIRPAIRSKIDNLRNGSDILNTSYLSPTNCIYGNNHIRKVYIDLRRVSPVQGRRTNKTTAP